jgi:HTH-type transcriptional regulator, quorum sensing regulator NprR
VKNPAAMTGMLIRKYRLEQNMSQEALCEGICAVSYLSKIEKGTVVCSDEILCRLFDILGVYIPENSEGLHLYAKKLNDYYGHFFLSNREETAAIMDKLSPKRDMLLHSYLAIDMMLVEAYDKFNNYDGKFDLKPQLLELLQCEDYMNDLQTHRMYLLLGRYEAHISGDYAESLKYYKLAHNYKSDGIVLEALSTAHYLLGNYLESITLGDEAYSKLMEEGYLDRAMNLCFVIGAAYANLRNTDKMLQYYNRVLSLNSITQFKLQKGLVYYNIGSAYLAKKDYANALDNLDKAFELIKDEKDDADTYLLLMQKLFLTHMPLKQKVEAEVYLNLALDYYDNRPDINISNSLKASLEWMYLMHSLDNYNEEQTYLDAVKAVYELSLKDSHHGHQHFYGSYLIETYKAQRKYKEALKVTEDLYVNKQFS